MSAQEEGAERREQENRPVTAANGHVASAGPEVAAAAVPASRKDGGASDGEGGNEETNVWPTEAEEAAFLAEAGERGEKVVAVTREREDEIEDDSKALPKLDELVNRIPAETRELLDELFRARFVTVRRVKKKDLKA